jgi:hypothetical protein
MTVFGFNVAIRCYPTNTRELTTAASHGTYHKERGSSPRTCFGVDVWNEATTLQF